MILDTSALIAILLNEPEAVRFAGCIEDAADGVFLSAACYLEASIIIDRSLDAVRRAMLDTFLDEFDIRVEPVTFEQARIARTAFREFGKGRHPAKLNFGDCFTYALARVKRQKLLFKGNDFSKTDIVAASVVQ